MMRQRFLVRFWGVRGSYPTPGPHTIRHGGNTSCVEVQAGEHTLIFDAGSGIIRLGNELLRHSNGDTLDLSLFITHAHGDHLIGFPFFVPLFDPRTNLDIFGPRLAGRSIEQIVTPLMSPPYFPVDVRNLPSHRTYHTVVDEQCISWVHDGGKPELQVLQDGSKDDEAHDALRVLAKFTRSHPQNGALIYRIEYMGRRVVYATDVEWTDGCDPEILELVKGADLLIHDAQYTVHDYDQDKRGFGHSTLEMALETAIAAHVGQLVLFHHEPTYDDDQLDRMEAEARKRFPQTYSAREGMEIDLSVLNSIKD